MKKVSAKQKRIEEEVIDLAMRVNDTLNEASTITVAYAALTSAIVVFAQSIGDRPVRLALEMAESIDTLTLRVTIPAAEARRRMPGGPRRKIRRRA